MSVPPTPHAFQASYARKLAQRIKDRTPQGMQTADLLGRQAEAFGLDAPGWCSAQRKALSLSSVHNWRACKLTGSWHAVPEVVL